jgi:hypothetical protein
MPFISNAGGYVGPIGFNGSTNASINHIGFFTSGSSAFFYTIAGGTLSGGAIPNGCTLSGSLTFFV